MRRRFAKFDQFCRQFGILYHLGRIHSTYTINIRLKIKSGEFIFASFKINLEGTLFHTVSWCIDYHVWFMRYSTRAILFLICAKKNRRFPFIRRIHLPDERKQHGILEQFFFLPSAKGVQVFSLRIRHKWYRVLKLCRWSLIAPCLILL